MGGYGNLPRLLEQYGDVRVAGLYDVGEERHFLRALRCDERDDLERAGFYACTRDLEDELTRAVGPDGMERVLGEQGELRAFRTYQKQPAHRDRPLAEQLHGFMWNRKQRYAVLLVEALAAERAPRPPDGALMHVSRGLVPQNVQVSALGSAPRGEPPSRLTCHARLWLLPCGAWHLPLSGERSCSVECSISAC